MDYIKLDTGILNSSLWIHRADRDIFITALLMAYPYEFSEPQKQISVHTLDYTGYEVPPAWYGFIEAAGPGIVNRALVPNEEGMAALERLCSPDPNSRSQKFEGRRLLRVDHGYLALNYMEYLLRDRRSAERVRRFRERQRLLRGNVTCNNSALQHPKNNATRNNSALQPPAGNVTCNHGDRDGDGDKSKNKIARSAHESGSVERPNDEIWDAVLTACGLDPNAALTKNERGRINTAVKQLREVGATPRLIAGKSRAYRHRWPGIELTPTALASNWSQVSADVP